MTEQNHTGDVAQAALNPAPLEAIASELMISSPHDMRSWASFHRAFRKCTASQPPAAPVDLTNHHNALKCLYCNPKGLQFAEPTAPVEEERKTFTIPPGYEAVRDAEGRATGEVRPRSSADTARQWISPIETVADLVNNLLTVDQTMQAFGAYFLPDGFKDNCRARGLSLSREHVANTRIKRDDAVPYSLVIWTAQDQRIGDEPQGVRK